MNFELEEDHKLLQDLMARFVRESLMPLENKVMERDAGGKGAYLSDDEKKAIDARSQELGLWGLDAPEDVGGVDLPWVALIGVNIELGKTCVPYHLPPDSPNLRMLMATVNADQRERYLALETRGTRYNLGVKFGLTEAQLSLAMSGKDRDQILALLLESIASLSMKPPRQIAEAAELVAN